jgi:hypothetical protein
MRLRESQGLVSAGLFLVIALLPWLVAVLRAPIYLGLELLYLPVARYAYAAIIPTVLALNLGLFMAWNEMDRRSWGWTSSQWWGRLTVLLGIGGLLLFAIFAITSILVYYQR